MTQDEDPPRRAPQPDWSREQQLAPTLEALTLSPLTLPLSSVGDLGEGTTLTAKTVRDHAFADEGEGPRLGRFLLGEELGRGGMGRVLRARDPGLCRDVALKTLLDPEQVQPEQLARFVAEAQITGQLEHPGIMPVHELGLAEDGELFMVMKRVEGPSLGEVLKGLRSDEDGTHPQWSRQRLISAFVQVCKAMAYAHGRGVLHRDLKPDNIMLGAFGEVLVMDWGIARVQGQPEERFQSERLPGVDSVQLHKTMAGSTVGTPGYMSPEQIQGLLDQLDARSDVFSLGAILYEILTLGPAYQADSVVSLLFATLKGLPQDPRERAPEARISEELAKIVLKALAPLPEDRHPDAQALAQDVEDFLDGVRRRDEAAQRMEEAAELWAEHGRLEAEQSVLIRRERLEADLVESWASLEEKAPILDLRQRLEDLEVELAGTFARVVAACDRALSQDPGHPAARAFLAQVFWARFAEAERKGDRRDQRYYEARVRDYDDGSLASSLRGTGSLSLNTEPSGAEIVLERFEQRGLVWARVGRHVFGRSPLSSVPLEMGSYLLTLRAPGREPTRYPVHITRGRHWDAGRGAVLLPRRGSVPEGFTYVPPGPFLAGANPRARGALELGNVQLGAFLISKLPVTLAQYRDFINSLHLRDPDSAWARVPRQTSGLKEIGGQYWERPQPSDAYVVPEIDRDGDPWDARWPVVGISWDDARAYASWASRRLGRRLRLPTELEWEKAARGVDGRRFPWGDRFDPALCLMAKSHQGKPMPMPVGGKSTDCSVYGLRDAAGGVREWCADGGFDGDLSSRPVRGGAWLGPEELSVLSARSGVLPSVVHTTRGFRLACDLDD